MCCVAFGTLLLVFVFFSLFFFFFPHSSFFVVFILCQRFVCFFQGNATGLEDGGESDDSISASADGSMDVSAMEDDDDDEYSSTHRRRGGSGATKGGKSPARRGSARLGGGSGSVGDGEWSASPPKLTVVDSELARGTGDRQVGLLLQKSNTVRVGCRFAFRVARTPEDVQDMVRERAATGIEWAKYEVPDDDLELDFEAYPGLVQAPLPRKKPPPRLLEIEGGSSSSNSGGGVVGDSADILPGTGDGEQKEASGDGGGGGSDGEDDLFNLYVALQGWVKHDVGDAEVVLRPRGAAAVKPAFAGAVAAAAAAADATGAGASSEGGGDVLSIEGTDVAASTSDSTNLAAAAVASADAAAAAEEMIAAATPLQVLDDETTEAIKFQQSCLRSVTSETQARIARARDQLNRDAEAAAKFR